MNFYRSHNCGELNVKNIDQDVHISGWVNKKRDHGGLLFVDLRDEYGITQCVVNADNPSFNLIENLKLESVIKVSGKVLKRSDDTINPNLPTGEIEVLSNEILILNDSHQIPFQVAINDDSPEELRLKFRYGVIRFLNEIDIFLLLRAILNKWLYFVFDFKLSFSKFKISDLKDGLNTE